MRFIERLQQRLEQLLGNMECNSEVYLAATQQRHSLTARATQQKQRLPARATQQKQRLTARMVDAINPVNIHAITCTRCFSVPVMRPWKILAH